MSIWKHANTAEMEFLHYFLMNEPLCYFCKTCMQRLELPDHWSQENLSYAELHARIIQGEDSFVEFHGLENEPETWQLVDSSPSEIFVNLFVCPACGWWTIDKQAAFDSVRQLWDMFFRACGTLRSLDIADIRLQLDEVRSYLRAQYESRFSIHPRKFEEVVASVFNDLGYKSAVTAYSRDGGIDVLLHNQKGERIGVQVKRYKNRIKVERIRSFAGALMLGGFVRGIFVTTSNYPSGAMSVAQQAEKTCVPIELLDASAFFEALGVAQLASSDPMSEVRDMIASGLPPKLHFFTEHHRNSL
jgi:restriction system protein